MHIKCILHKLNNIDSKPSNTKDMNANIHLPYHRTPWSLPLVSELTLSSQWPLHTNTVQCSKRLNPRSDKLGVWCPSLLDQKKIIFAALWYIQTIGIMNQKDNTLDIAVSEESHASGNSYWNLNLIKSHNWYLVVSHQNVDLFRSNLIWQKCCSHHMAFISLEASTPFNNVPFDCQKKKVSSGSQSLT